MKTVKISIQWINMNSQNAVYEIVLYIYTCVILKIYVQFHLWLMTLIMFI
jgi:hypothetical protein